MRVASTASFLLLGLAAQSQGAPWDAMLKCKNQDTEECKAKKGTASRGDVLRTTPQEPEFCAGSPAQYCRMRCPRTTCPEGQCAMRTGHCCDVACDVDVRSNVSRDLDDLRAKCASILSCEDCLSNSSGCYGWQGSECCDEDSCFNALEGDRPFYTSCEKWEEKHAMEKTCLGIPEGQPCACIEAGCVAQQVGTTSACFVEYQAAAGNPISPEECQAMVKLGASAETTIDPDEYSPFCSDSPEQLCKMLCAPADCPAGQCMMRLGNCCDLTCKPIEPKQATPTPLCPGSVEHACEAECSPPTCPEGQCASGACCEWTCKPQPPQLGLAQPSEPACAAAKSCEKCLTEGGECHGWQASGKCCASEAQCRFDAERDVHFYTSCQAWKDAGDHNKKCMKIEDDACKCLKAGCVPQKVAEGAFVCFGSIQDAAGRVIREEECDRATMIGPPPPGAPPDDDDESLYE